MNSIKSGILKISASGSCLESQPDSDICDTMTKIINIQIPRTPELCLLGNATNLKFGWSSGKLVDLALTVSRKCIALTWKSDSSLSISKLQSEIMTCLPLEKITCNEK